MGLHLKKWWFPDGHRGRQVCRPKEPGSFWRGQASGCNNIMPPAKDLLPAMASRSRPQALIIRDHGRQFRQAAELPRLVDHIINRIGELGAFHPVHHDRPDRHLPLIGFAFGFRPDQYGQQVKVVINPPRCPYANGRGPIVEGESKTVPTGFAPPLSWR